MSFTSSDTLPFMYLLPPGIKFPEICVVCARPAGNGEKAIRWGADGISYEFKQCRNCRELESRRVRHEATKWLRRAWWLFPVACTPWFLFHALEVFGAGNLWDFLQSWFFYGFVLLMTFCVIYFEWAQGTQVPIGVRISESEETKGDRTLKTVVFQVLDPRYAMAFERINPGLMRSSEDETHVSAVIADQFSAESAQKTTSSGEVTETAKRLLKEIWDWNLISLAYPLPRPPARSGIPESIEIRDMNTSQSFVKSMPLRAAYADPEVLRTLTILAAPEPGDTSELIRLLSDEKRRLSMRCYAALALGEAGLGCANAEEALSKALESKERAVRYCARYGLDNLKSGNNQPAQRTFDS